MKKIITMNNSLAEEYSDIFTNNMKSMKDNDAIIKDKPRIIGSNSFKFWLEVDKVRKANTRKQLGFSKIIKFKKSLNSTEEIYTYYELKEWIITSLTNKIK